MLYGACQLSFLILPFIRIFNIKSGSDDGASPAYAGQPEAATRQQQPWPPVYPFPTSPSRTSGYDMEDCT